MKIILRTLLPFVLAIALVGTYLHINGAALVSLLGQHELYVFGIFLLFLKYSWYAHLFIHEGGHYFFGKLTGYQLISFQVKQFIYSKKIKKIAYLRSGGAALSGQCLMFPPSKGSYAEKPFKLYILGGVILNGLTGMGLYCLSFQLDPKFGLFMVLFSLLPMWMALTNSWPYGQNDGAIACQASRSVEAKELFFYQLEIAALLDEGVTFTKIPARYFLSLEEERYTKTNLVDFLYMVAYLRALGMLSFERADRLLKEFNAKRPSIKSAYWPIFALESLFCDAIFGRTQAAKEKYDLIQKQPLLKKQWDASKRIKAAYAFFVEVDMKKAKLLLKEAKLNLDGLATPADKEIEKNLIDWLQSYFVS